MPPLRRLALVAALIAAACVPEDEGAPRVSRVMTDEQAVVFATDGGTHINYHGGPVMLGTVNVYFIWYGGWPANDTAKTLLPDLVTGLGGSSYYNINTGYKDGLLRPVSNSVKLVKQVVDTGTSKTLSDTGVRTLINNHMGTDLPIDANGLYMLLTYQDVNESSGFCTQYCGWHTNATLHSIDAKYAFIGDGARCPSGCSAQMTTPNGNLGADAMASILTHELEEAATDPDGNAWWDSTTGDENADKCAWTFGTTQDAGMGAQYNVTLGGHKFLIQQNWVNAGSGSCAMALAGPAGFALAASPAGQNIVSGAAAASQLLVSVSGEFKDPVLLTASDVPPGATLTFDPNPMTSRSTMSVTTSAATPPGAYLVTVTGGSGELAQSTTFSLQVGAPQGFSLAVSPAYSFVRAGRRAKLDVAINRQSGFTGAVDLSVSGLPPGATARFSRPSNDHATLTLDTPRELIGAFPLEIDGVSGDVTASTFATLDLAPGDKGAPDDDELRASADGR